MYSKFDQIKKSEKLDSWKEDYKTNPHTKKSLNLD